MAPSLSLVLSALLVLSSTFVASESGRGKSRLLYRDVLQDFDDCTGPGWETDLLARFTGIFFGDFYTGGDKDILGALAVEGDLHAPNYIVNVDHGADCANVNSFNSYGLVVGGKVDTFNTNVHGSAYIAGGGTIEEVIELDEGCSVTDQQGTGLFDFGLVKELLQGSSQDFATHPATAILETDGSLTNIRDSELSLYEILVFHTCQSTSCSSDKAKESDPSHIFFNKGSWNGVHGLDVNPDKTYVLNIPVTNGDTFTMTTPHPSSGFNPCNVIYNLYPVDANGNYMADGTFTFHRRTSDPLQGFVLAPRGHILDGNTGNFGGQVVGLDYTWQNLNSGVEILDYKAGGADCDYFIGCLPDHATTTPTFVPTSSPISTTSRSRTRTWSFTGFPSPKPQTTTVTYKPTFRPTINTSNIISIITRRNTRTRTKTGTNTSVISDSTTTYTTVETLTEITTETETETQTETWETFTETSCPEDNTLIVTVDSTEIETLDEHTDFVTVSVPARTTTITASAGTITTTEKNSVASFTEYETATRRKILFKPRTRTVTDCNKATCTNDETSTETCGGHGGNDCGGHHHGHHHGPNETCEEGEEGEDGDDDENDEKYKGEKYYNKEDEEDNKY